MFPVLHSWKVLAPNNGAEHKQQSSSSETNRWCHTLLRPSLCWGYVIAVILTTLVVNTVTSGSTLEKAGKRTLSWILSTISKVLNELCCFTHTQRLLFPHSIIHQCLPKTLYMTDQKWFIRLWIIFRFCTTFIAVWLGSGTKTACLLLVRKQSWSWLQEMNSSLLCQSNMLY